ncbi:hypothetical protein AVEN_182175-1 [Araneus ventricosus]|uniref:Uncharacterized protein n=1 Tax=Araneus ventricosus TaxID=182803 RepID=A0A4Y2GLK8_ARAVE|nr:hypothetical protein AVEN_182175-1 [Araneus ventricosus]
MIFTFKTICLQRSFYLFKKLVQRNPEFVFLGKRHRMVKECQTTVESEGGDRTPPHAPVPVTITVTEPVGWTWNKEGGDKKPQPVVGRGSGRKLIEM